MKWVLALLLMTLSAKAFSEGDQEGRSNGKEYELLLPSLDSTLSFIVDKSHLGVYDKLSRKELFLEDSVSAIKISPITAYRSYIDFLIEDDNGKLTIKETYVISKGKNMKISIVKNDSKKRESTYSDNSYYFENNVRVIDKDKVIHNLSTVEPSLTSEGLRIVQRSGVYSLKEKRFVIPPKHIRIEVNPSPEYDKMSPVFFSSLAVEEDESIHKMEYLDEAGYLLDLPVKNFRYGLYTSDIQEIIKPTSINIFPMRFGGFIRVDGTNELYDKTGFKLVTEGVSVPNYKDVFTSKNYIIVRHDSDGEEYDLDDEEVYSFYRKDGQFVESKSMEISKFFALPKKALGMVNSYDSNFEYITHQGIFDFDENMLVIPDIYDEIKVVKNEIDYHFLCQKGEDTSYYDQNFKIIENPSK